MSGEPSRETRWNGGVGHEERLNGVLRQRHLVNEHGDVRENQAGVDERIGAAGVEIFERDEHAGVVAAEYRKRRELQAGEGGIVSDNIWGGRCELTESGNDEMRPV